MHQMETNIIPSTTSFPRQVALDVSLCHTGAVAVFTLGEKI